MLVALHAIYRLHPAINQDILRVLLGRNFVSALRTPKANKKLSYRLETGRQQCISL